MKITTANYFDSVKALDWNSVPASLKKTHESLIPEVSFSNWAAYLEDKDIQRVVEKYFEYIGKYASLPANPKAAKIIDTGNSEVSEETKSAARDFAKNMLRPYVIRRESLESLKTSSLGLSSERGSVSISGNRVIVDRLGAEQIRLVFPLSNLYAELKKERPVQKSKSLQPKLTEELPEPRLVTHIRTASSFIKRYVALHGKIKTRDHILSLIHGLQKAIVEQRINKDDPAIAEIEKMQGELIGLANSMGESAKIQIDDAALSHYRQIAQGEEVRTTVKLIKSFISINGKAIAKEKSAALLAKMEKALQTVPSEDPYLPELKTAIKALTNYAHSDRVPIPPTALHGLGAVALRGTGELGSHSGRSEPAVIRLLHNAAVTNLSDASLRKAFKTTIAPDYFFQLAKAHIRAGQLSMDVLNRAPLKIEFNGVSGLDSTSDTPALNELDVIAARLESTVPKPIPATVLGSITEPPNATFAASPVQQQTISAKELAKMQFKTIGYKGQFKDVIGDPAIGFHMMVYGKPYNGKSSFVIELCKDLAKLSKGRIAYLALEEGISLSMQKKVIDRGADKVEGLEFKGVIPPSFSGYGFVVIDSVSDRSISREKLREMFLQFPQVCFICIFHATKAGTARGGLDYSHDMDIIIRIEDHEPIVEKNRFL